MAFEKDRNPRTKQGKAPAAAEGELEKYGVWVKADPQDITEDSDLPETLDIDVDSPAFSSGTGGEESFLTEEEENLLGSIESFDQGKSIQVEEIPELLDLDEEIPQQKAPPRKAAAPASDEIEFTDFSVEDFTGEPSSAPVEAFPASEKKSGGVEEFSVDDFLDEAPRASEAKELEAGLDDSPIDIDLEFDDSLPEETQDASGAPALEEFNLDTIGSDSGEIDLGDVTPSRSKSSSAEMEEVGIDEMISLDVDEEIPEFGTSPSIEVETSVGGLGDAAAGFSEGAPDSFAGEEGLPEDIESMDLSLGEAVAKPRDFDDIAAVEADLGAQERRASKALPQGGMDGEEKEILLKIAQELSSIKTELSSLRDRMDHLQGQPLVQGESEDKAAKGFFDEEEDETIALTGDELDNILNTADFTEETGTDSGESLSLEAEQPKADLSDLPDILGEEGEALSPAGDAGFVEGDSGDAEINLLKEVEVTPITKAPEDTSYLDLDAEPDFGDITLDEKPLVEPALDDISIETSEELPVVHEEVDEFAPIEEILIDESEVSPAVQDLDLSSEQAIEDIDLTDETPIEGEESVALPRAGVKEGIPDHLKQDVRSVLSYMDKLLESLPEDKIEEFAKSEHFQVYKKLFEELGLL